MNDEFMRREIVGVQSGDETCNIAVEMNSPDSADGRQTGGRAAPHSGRVCFEFFAGVLLPGIAFLIEAWSQMCADVFFDPMPTPVHVLLVAMVPAVNLFQLIRTTAGGTPTRPVALWMNGIALSVSFVYSLVFLPLIPLAVVAILAMGMGLLPLAPVFALLAGWSIRCRLKDNLATPIHSPVPLIVPAFGIALALLLLPELPDILTRTGLNRAVHGSLESRADSIAFLRQYGSDNSLLSYCYPSFEFRMRDGWAGSSPGLRISNMIPCDVTPEQAVEVYYRVTGNSFRSVPPPSTRGAWWPDDDEGLGGTVVGGHLDNLQLARSRLDVAIDANSLVAYSEWTLLFQNDARWEQEARGQIQLPPGGVVSRLTLWIDGEPCEAAFGGAGSVRKAYQEVAVAQRRDPVLVTHAGIDRVLMQCFPVPPAGSMQIRIGITAPLVPSSEHRAPLILPCLNETNFRTAADHITWVTGANVSGRGVKRVGGGYQAAWNDEQFSEATDLKVELPALPKVARTIDPADEQRMISQHVRRSVPQPTRSIVAVVDGSLSMHPHFDVVAAALTAMQEPATSGSGSELRVIVAGDTVVQLDRSAMNSETALFNGLRGGAADGGCDNLPALIEAWDVAVRKGSKDILWFHGPQPVSLTSADLLAQRFEYANAGITIHCLSTVSGPNRVLESLPAGADVLVYRAQLDTLPEQVRKIPGGLPFVIERTAALVTENASAEMNGSDHLARLWANQEVHRALRRGLPQERERATTLAVGHRIVTPVSGAVVLESQAQYDAAGLEPVDPQSVPTIPEPEVWLLLLLGVILVVALVVHQSRSRRIAV
ncbi:MAG: VIT domain-containing protein [Planctomycetaceae bacterium]